MLGYLGVNLRVDFRAALRVKLPLETAECDADHVPMIQSAPFSRELSSSHKRCTRSMSSGHRRGGCGPRLKKIDCEGSGRTISNEIAGRGGWLLPCLTDSLALFRRIACKKRRKPGNNSRRLQALRDLYHTGPWVGGSDREELDMFACLFGHSDHFGKKILLGRGKYLIGIEVELTGAAAVTR